MSRGHLLWAVVLCLAPTVAAAVHPLHTATLVLQQAPTGQTLVGTLRVFADDAQAAAGADSAALARYLAPRVRFFDRRGAPLPVRFGAPTRDALMLVIPVQVPAPTGLRAEFAVLHERFRDQVNVLRVRQRSGERTVLFLAGDGQKAIL